MQCCLHAINATTGSAVTHPSPAAQPRARAAWPAAAASCPQPRRLWRVTAISLLGGAPGPSRSMTRAVYLQPNMSHSTRSRAHSGVPSGDCFTMCSISSLRHVSHMCVTSKHAPARLDHGQPAGLVALQLRRQQLLDLRAQCRDMPHRHTSLGGTRLSAPGGGEWWCADTSLVAEGLGPHVNACPVSLASCTYAALRHPWFWVCSAK